MEDNGINPSAAPSGSGCVECEESGGWWFHLRRCAECGHVGCCDDSPSQHAQNHWRTTGHRVMQSFEPGESWFWDYLTQRSVHGPVLAPPQSHPVTQPVPGPAGRVPADWEFKLHA
ncbi:UBP-type zinc finger domain-containing protein [Actinacidiphila rubida]|uniref:Ubiquitin-hydrolase Zn-finger-containing protein n=1 Tax=Actinacidiphila rubida TaxID=310780 RepID=A0A1H8PX77_9ACTN|nr:UBP-type zinc finger domain-containing protein [Actinacidiphila rubida]SEO46589.1 ubiquitin-hydrolase Zn-finger-containing protein [Actinacidiphila rubida]